MGFEFKDKLETYDTIEKLCDRIDLELDEEYPWMSIIRYLVGRIRELNNEGKNN